jgi:hypothetical protein
MWTIIISKNEHLGVHWFPSSTLFRCPQNKIYKNHPLSFPKGEEDLMGAYHLVSLAIKNFAPNYSDSTFFPRLSHGMVSYEGHVWKSNFLGHERISALEIRVLKVLHIGVFKYLNSCFLIMSCPLLFHHYTYSIRFWDYPKWGYNSKFGLTLIMSPLHLSYKSSFLFQNVGHSHDALCMCKIVRDSVTCIVKLMDDLNIFCKMYLGGIPIFTFSLLQSEN